MDSRSRERAASDDAVEFVRFCYSRRRVGWPELYDEMCAVAGRGLFRGWGSDELSAEGIGFSLFEMPALASPIPSLSIRRAAISPCDPILLPSPSVSDRSIRVPPV